MMFILSLLFGLFPILANAQVAIKSLDASPIEFQMFLKENPSAIPYSKYRLQGLQNNRSQEEKILKLGDILPQQIDLTTLHLKGFQKESPLTLTSLRFLKDLTESTLLQNVSKADRIDLLFLNCKASILLNEGPINANCESQLVSLKDIKKKYPEAQYLAIEGVVFNLSEDARVPVAARTPYHWNIYSDSQEPLHFYGTYEQMLQQERHSNDLIKGTCQSYELDSMDFNEIFPAKLFFSGSCQRLSHSTQSRQSWIPEKKTWLYIAGATALGILAYSMKDKKLVFNK